MNYVIFNERELEILNTIDNETTRKKVMGFYRFMILNADKDWIYLSYKKMLGKWNTRRRKIKMSAGTLHNRLEKLIELKLLEGKKVGLNKKAYKLNRNPQIDNSELNKKMNEKMNEFDNFADECFSDLIEKKDVPKSKIQNVNYGLCIEDAAKATSIALELLKDLKIKKELVRNAVLNKVKRLYSSINLKGAYSLITTWIIQISALDKAAAKVASIAKFRNLKNSNNYSNQNQTATIPAKFTNKKNLRFTNYTQRSYTVCEEDVMGWDD